MREATALLLAAAASGCLAGPSPLVGTVGPPWKGDWTGRQGACVSLPDSGGAHCAYAIGVLSRPGHSAIYFAERLESLAENVPRWRVLDAIPMPAVPRGHRLVFLDCSRAGMPDPTLIAVLRETSKAQQSAVRSARGIDPETKRFRPVPAGTVTCDEKV